MATAATRSQSRACSEEIRLEGNGLHGLLIASSTIDPSRRWLAMSSTKRFTQIHASINGTREAIFHPSGNSPSPKCAVVSFVVDKAAVMANMLCGAMTVLKSLFVKRNSVFR